MHLVSMHIAYVVCTNIAYDPVTTLIRVFRNKEICRLYFKKFSDYSIRSNSMLFNIYFYLKKKNDIGKISPDSLDTAFKLNT